MKTINDFIDFYESIPEDKWWAGGTFYDPNNPESMCALGHLNKFPVSTRNALEDLIRQYNGQKRIIIVNDGFDIQYYHNTPKQRVLAFLRDIRESHNAS